MFKAQCEISVVHKDKAAVAWEVAKGIFRVPVILFSNTDLKNIAN